MNADDRPTDAVGREDPDPDPIREFGTSEEYHRLALRFMSKGVQNYLDGEDNEVYMYYMARAQIYATLATIPHPDPQARIEKGVGSDESEDDNRP